MARAPDRPHPRLPIHQERLHADWERLSSFRAADQPGWTRRPFTPEYAAARAWLAERMADAGLLTEVDSVGNLVGRRAGKREDLPTIVLGSHIDTVAGGGRFDGMIGVLGAVEVARALRQQEIGLQHPLEVIDFLAEEPTDFGVSTVGSRGLVGALDGGMLGRRDGQGRTLAEAIELMGGRPDEIPGARRHAGSVALYLELHIEQGPVLESEGLRVGIVTGITGIARYRIELRGRADHAGTMPMIGRRDALTAAAEIALALEALWQDGRGVGTTGRLSVAPNATNVVPGQVELWCEMRSIEGPVLESRRQAFVERSEEIAARREIGVQIDPVSYEEPVSIPEEIQAGFDWVVRALGLPVRRLPSYAGHDGNQMAKIAPIGMLFVPSRAGRSHCPEEWTGLADVALGARVLGEALLRFDARPTAPPTLAP